MGWNGRRQAAQKSLGSHDRTAPHAGQRQQVGVSGDQGVGSAGGCQVKERHVERISTERYGRWWLRNANGLGAGPVSYTHLRAHETVLDLVCRLLLEKKK